MPPAGKRPGFWQKSLYGQGVWVYDIKGMIHEKNGMIRENAHRRRQFRPGGSSSGPEAILSRKEKPAA